MVTSGVVFPVREENVSKETEQRLLSAKSLHWHQIIEIVACSSQLLVPWNFTQETLQHDEIERGASLEVLAHAVVASGTDDFCTLITWMMVHAHTSAVGLSGPCGCAGKVLGPAERGFTIGITPAIDGSEEIGTLVEGEARHGRGEYAHDAQGKCEECGKHCDGKW